MTFADDEGLSARILLFRKEAGLSQQALAAFLGVSQRTVSRWERGVDRPGPGLQERLESLMGGGGDIAPAIYQAINQAPVALALIDGNGRILTASKSFVAPAEPAAGRSHPGLPMVLVVEDDESVLQATRAVLKRWRFMTAGAIDGESALAMTAHGHIRPDAAVIDFRLPGTLDGVDAALALRRIIADLPIVMVTGEENLEGLRKIAVSKLTVVTKPVDPQQLHIALKALLAAWDDY